MSSDPKDSPIEPPVGVDPSEKPIIADDPGGKDKDKDKDKDKRKDGPSASKGINPVQHSE